MSRYQSGAKSVDLLSELSFFLSFESDWLAVHAVASSLRSRLTTVDRFDDADIVIHLGGDEILSWGEKLFAPKSERFQAALAVTIDQERSDRRIVRANSPSDLTQWLDDLLALIMHQRIQEGQEGPKKLAERLSKLGLTEVVEFSSRLRVPISSSVKINDNVVDAYMVLLAEDYPYQDMDTLRDAATSCARWDSDQTPLDAANALAQGDELEDLFQRWESHD